MVDCDDSSFAALHLSTAYRIPQFDGLASGVSLEFRIWSPKLSNGTSVVCMKAK